MQTARQRRQQGADAQHGQTSPSGGAYRRAPDTTAFRGKKSAARPMFQKIATMCLSFLGLTAWYTTPISDYAVDLMLTQVPYEADRDLGLQSIKEFPYPTIYHPKWTPMVQQVGYELVQKAKKDSKPTDQYNWDFGVIDHPTMVNAFALPGGFVRVTIKLLEQLDLTKGELAALLAHEMGHVLHRHSQARMIQQKILGMIYQALTYEDGDDKKENFGEAIGEILLKSADWLGKQKFSRRDEYQADATGWDLLKESGKYNPRSIQKLLDKLWALNGRVGGTTSWESTHPGTLDRIQALDEKWKQLSSNDRRTIPLKTIV